MQALRQWVHMGNGVVWQRSNPSNEPSSLALWPFEMAKPIDSRRSIPHKTAQTRRLWSIKHEFLMKNTTVIL